jgi:hypothetical protein
MFFANIMAKSPVPVAISNIFLGLFLATIFTTYFRQPISKPKVKIRFRKSYSLETLSNISVTCSFLLSEESLYGVTVFLVIKIAFGKVKIIN